MSDSIKNNEYLNELIRYKNNKLSNQEMHRFEEALERDPFLAEALEGFSDFKSSDIEKDLGSINLVSEKGKLNRNPRVYLMVAASVAVLFIAYFILQKVDTSKQVASNEQKVSEPANLLIDSLYEPVEMDSAIYDEVDTIAPISTEGDKYELVSNREVLAKNIEKEAIPKKSKSLVEGKKDSTPDDLSLSFNRADEVSVAMAKAKVDDDSSPRGQGAKLTKAMAIKQPEPEEVIIPESESRVAELEPVETTILSTEEKPGTALRIGANSDPMPLGGFDLFKEYVEKNMRYPVSSEKKAREVVRVSFTVSKNGELTDFVVDKEPNNPDFSREAIRLLKEGPKWSPSIKDGVPLSAEMSYRFVFKSTEK